MNAACHLCCPLTNSSHSPQVQRHRHSISVTLIGLDASRTDSRPTIMAYRQTMHLRPWLRQQIAVPYSDCHLEVSSPRRLGFDYKYNILFSTFLQCLHTPYALI